MPCLEASCCKAEFTEEEIEAVTNCIRVELDEEEEAALYVICGYVSHQEGLPSDEILAPEALAPSQFTTLVSRGNLRHQPLYCGCLHSRSLLIVVPPHTLRV